jgi:predicted nuclease of predicted toxin-antitoxin system
MKFLMDTCVPREAVETLRSSGYDVVWLLEGESDPGDDAILQMALEQGRVLVTSDKDFGELAVRRRMSHGPIIRLRRIRIGNAGKRLVDFLGSSGSLLELDVLIVLEPGRYRLRRTG